MVTVRGNTQQRASEITAKYVAAGFHVVDGPKLEGTTWKVVLDK